MSDPRKINLEYLKNNYKKGLLIPEIQRDYVMGAGGKTGNGSDKLEMLLDAMLNAFNQNKNFDFSCVITYCENNDSEHNRLEIYDGQQRLTTLILLYLFCLQNEKNEEYKNYQNWYQFCGRPIANDILKSLTNENFRIDQIEIKDFSSFSMKNLLDRFNEDKYKSISSDFFLKNVMFDYVSIGSQSEIEQFFMDLNSGVKLKEYELYKAKLVHHINNLADTANYNKEEKEQLQSWTHKLDNEWLNVFLPFEDHIHPAEEYEVAFLRYCFKMLVKAQQNESKDNIDNIRIDILKDCYAIMNSISKLSLGCTVTKIPQVVEFSWGNDNEKSKIKKYCNEDKRCAYWNLSYGNNLGHLSFVIKNVLLESKYTSELEKDVIVWAYITSLEWGNECQNEYIRLLKIILNHNIGINKDAWYECQSKGQYLYYAKCGVINIPNYYGIHRDDKKYDHFQNDEIPNKIYSIMQVFFKNKPKEKIQEKMLEQLPEQDSIRKILEKRQSLISNYTSYEAFCEYENDYNGVLEKSNNPKGNYLENVTLSWPTRGKTSAFGLNDEPCFVLLKCYMDTYYSDYNEDNHKTVCKYESRYINDIFDKEKCFWAYTDLAYRIMDRTTNTSKTYTVRGGTDSYHWAYKFDGVNDCQEV